MFNVHDLKIGQSVFYNYQEGEARKEPNEVCTFLLNFIEQEVEIPHVFCDACSGENAGCRLCRLLLTFTMSGCFQEVHQ